MKDCTGKNKEVISVVGEASEINRLSALLSLQKKEGRLCGYSFLVGDNSELTAGDYAHELADVIEDHLKNGTQDVTESVLKGEY